MRRPPIPTPFALSFLAVLLAAPGCGLRDMGSSCSRSSQCADPGTCLRGVCSGYPCDSDADCIEEMSCELVEGTSTCAHPCQTDTDCPGDQLCTAVTPNGNPEDTGEVYYCL